jgi:uncharacterized protein involved in response to NO
MPRALWMSAIAFTVYFAVMTRVSLRHTGNALIAWPATQAIYAAIVIAALARMGSSLEPGWSDWLLAISAFIWAAAFWLCRNVWAVAGPSETGNIPVI